MVNLPLHDVAIVDYGADEAAMVRYREAGTTRALALDNRGPIRFDADGRLDPAIVDSYARHGFYIFTKVLEDEELKDIERDVAELLERAPVTEGAKVDRRGRPALGVDGKATTVKMVKPLSDPIGGTDALHGRHPAKMIEPKAPVGAPDYVMQLLLGSLQFSDACLRLYGHPQLLAIAEAINGPDFTPFSEAVWIKHPGLGGSVAWHQDGWSHWDNPERNEGAHGFNFMAQLYGCNAANGMWVVPGSHRHGKADIKAMAEAAGSDRLRDAAPLICAPGDVAITNRQAIHGSFANTSPDVRVTINFGFHRRKFVIGTKSDSTFAGVDNPAPEYDEDYVRQRSRLIMYAIDARRQRFPGETPYLYKPFAGSNGRFRWTPEARADIEDYNLQDIAI